MLLMRGSRLPGDVVELLEALMRDSGLPKDVVEPLDVFIEGLKASQRCC
jgi:hypothetical protein